MDDNVFNSISVENFHCDSPDNYNIAASIGLSQIPYASEIVQNHKENAKIYKEYS